MWLPLARALDPMTRTASVAVAELGARTRTPWVHHLALWAFVAGTAVPYHIASPIGSVSTISLLDVTLCLEAPYAVLVLLHDQFPRVMRLVLAALIVPLACTVLSLLWSSDYSRTIKGVANYCEATVAFLVAYALFSRVPVRTALRYVAIFAVLLVIPALGSQLGLPFCEPQILDTVSHESSEYANLKTSYDSRLSHPFIGMHNDFATVLSLFVLSLFAGASLYRSRALLLGGVVCLTACCLTQSRGVLAALFLGGMGVLFANRERIWKRRGFVRTVVTAVFAGTVLVTLVLVYGSYNEALLAHLDSRFTDEALVVRAERLAVAADAMTTEPLTGLGGNVVPSTTLGNMHNTFVEQVVYFGLILGPIADFALISVPFVLWRSGRRMSSGPLLSSAMTWTFVAQLVSFAGETSFEAYLPKTYVYLAAGLFVALLASMQVEWQASNLRRYQLSS